MTDYSDRAAPETPELTAHQREMLSLVEQQDLLDSFNQVLIDRGIALQVSAVEFNELAFVSVEDAGIGPDPSTLPDTGGGPPGSVYICRRDPPGTGPWVCSCENPPEHPPFSIQPG